MKRFTYILILALECAGSTPLWLAAGEQSQSQSGVQPPHSKTDPTPATLRIKSHGASATVIATTKGKSWILGCAHMLTDKNGNPSRA